MTFKDEDVEGRFCDILGNFTDKTMPEGINSKGTDRTDASGSAFRDEAVQFVDKAEKIFEKIKPEKTADKKSIDSGETKEQEEPREGEYSAQFGIYEELADHDVKSSAQGEKTIFKRGSAHQYIDSKDTGRIDTSGTAFREKAVHFADKTEKTFENIRPEENEAAASHMDSKAEILFDHGTNRAWEKKRHYKKEAKDAGLEQKRLKKDIKKPPSEEELFNSSKAQFKEKAGEEVFTETDDAKFLKPEQKTSGEPYFQNREEREEKLAQAKERRRASDRKENKEVRKAAAMTAASKMFSAKKNIQNQLGDMSGQETGDLLKDGSAGLLSTFTDGIKQLSVGVVKTVGIAIANWISAAIGALIVPASVFFIICVFLALSISAIGGVIAANSDAGESYDLDVNGDGYVYQNLTSAEIDNIIKEIYKNDPDLSKTPEAVLRYALSKVGCAYNQAYHGSLTVDIFDCSSLAYRSYQQAGIDISNEGNYCAASECYELVLTDRLIKDQMMPGDLIFYGGSDNGRYLGIYHVAIYVGKINGADKMVEARGPSWGVVYCDVRSKNAIKIARPY